MLKVLKVKKMLKVLKVQKMLKGIGIELKGDDKNLVGKQLLKKVQI